MLKRTSSCEKEVIWNAKSNCLRPADASWLPGIVLRTGNSDEASIDAASISALRMLSARLVAFDDGIAERLSRLGVSELTRAAYLLNRRLLMS